MTEEVAKQSLLHLFFAKLTHFFSFFHNMMVWGAGAMNEVDMIAAASEEVVVEGMLVALDAYAAMREVVKMGDEVVGTVMETVTGDVRCSSVGVYVSAS